MSDIQPIPNSDREIFDKYDMMQEIKDLRSELESLRKERGDLLKWIDEEMEKAAFVINAESYTPNAKVAQTNVHFTFRRVKEKIQSLMPPAIKTNRKP